MHKIQTAHNFKRKAFIFNQPSMIVPGQVHSIGAIFQRFQRGQGVQTFPGVYNPDVPPGYEGMNKIERIEAAREQASKVAKMRSMLAEQVAREKAQAAEQAAGEASKQASEQTGQ